MIRVLIVDDSVLARKALISALEKAPGISVVGEAGDAYEAREKILALEPDVITLDVEMPRMNGLRFLQKLMEHHPLPVVMLSAVTMRGSQEAIEALEMGAVDVLGKPKTAEDVETTFQSLVLAVRAAAVSRRIEAHLDGSQVAAPGSRTAFEGVGTERLLAIGASTGGTVAIRNLLEQLPRNIPGTLIVQHMPEGFTKAFAERLDATCPQEVREACPGDRVQPGVVLVAPGDRHMVLERGMKGWQVQIRKGPRVHFQRPSVDVLFQSVARLAGPAAVGVILTGMGADGAGGLLAMREAGARTIGQEEKTCVVYGMPREAMRMGATEKEVPIWDMGAEILRALRAGARPPSGHEKAS